MDIEFSMSADNQAQIKGDKGASIFVGIPREFSLAYLKSVWTKYLDLEKYLRHQII